MSHRHGNDIIVYNAKCWCNTGGRSLKFYSDLLIEIKILQSTVR